MANPNALATFQPFPVGEGPVSVIKPVFLRTNLSGDPIRFSLNEDLGNIVNSATLTILNASVEGTDMDLGVIGGVSGGEDMSMWGKEVPNAQVEPNELVYIAEILGTENIDWVEVGTEETGFTYELVPGGNGEICTTHWRIVSANLSITDDGIPTCDVTLESLSKIAQEAKIDARAMGSNDNSIIIITKRYLDSLVYYAEKYHTEDNYSEIVTLAEYLSGLLPGTTVTTNNPTTTPGVAWPNPTNLYIKYPPAAGYGTYMNDGDPIPGTSLLIDGIQDAQLALAAKGYRGIDGYVLQGTGNYAENTKHAVLALQAKYEDLSDDGILGENTWKKLFPDTTTTTPTTTTVAPSLLLIVIDDSNYCSYCDIFFQRIRYEGYNFFFTNPLDVYQPTSYCAKAAENAAIQLATVPIYTVYETGQSCWEIINNIFSFNGLNLRFRRDNSLLVWPSGTLQVIDTEDSINVGNYETGLTLSYTKDGVINKAHVKGWVGKLTSGESEAIPTYAPNVNTTGGSAYPNPVSLTYPGVSGYICDGYMRDGCHGITAVATIQQALIAKGYSCGPSGADGIYGSDTKSAVASFQLKVGLGGSGNFGPKTWAKLFPTSTSTSMKRSDIAAALSSINGVTVISADLTDATIADFAWLTTRYPILFPSTSTYTTPALSTIITWSEFTILVNAYIATISTVTGDVYWVPDAKTEEPVDAYSALADEILNRDGHSFNAVSNDFEVSADYLLSSIDQLVKYGEKEIFKTVITARSGSYASNSLPLRTEVGMQVTGSSVLTGTTTLLIVSLSRTTDVQQQLVSTSISGNLVKTTGTAYSWV